MRKYKELSYLGALILWASMCVLTDVAENANSDELELSAPSETEPQEIGLDLDYQPAYYFYSSTGLKVNIWKSKDLLLPTDSEPTSDRYFYDTGWIIRYPEKLKKIRRIRDIAEEGVDGTKADIPTPGYQYTGMYKANPSGIVRKECIQHLEEHGIANPNVGPLLPYSVRISCKDIPGIEVSAIYSSDQLDIMPIMLWVPEGSEKEFEEAYKREKFNLVQDTTIAFSPKQTITVRYDSTTKKRFENELRTRIGNSGSITMKDLTAVAEKVLSPECVDYYIDNSVANAAKRIVLDQWRDLKQITMNDVKSVLSKEIKLSAAEYKGAKELKTFTSPVQFRRDHRALVAIIPHTQSGIINSAWGTFNTKSLYSEEGVKRERMIFSYNDIEGMNKYKFDTNSISLRIWAEGDPQSYDAKIVEVTENSITVEASIHPQNPTKGHRKHLIGGRRYYKHPATVFVQPTCRLYQNPGISSNNTVFRKGTEVIPIESTNDRKEQLKAVEVVFEDGYKEIYSAESLKRNDEVLLGVVSIKWQINNAEEPDYLIVKDLRPFSSVRDLEIDEEVNIIEGEVLIKGSDLSEDMLEE